MSQKLDNTLGRQGKRIYQSQNNKGRDRAHLLTRPQQRGPSSLAELHCPAGTTSRAVQSLTGWILIAKEEVGSRASSPTDGKDRERQRQTEEVH